MNINLLTESCNNCLRKDLCREYKSIDGLINVTKMRVMEENGFLTEDNATLYLRIYECIDYLPIIGIDCANEKNDKMPMNCEDCSFNSGCLNSHLRDSFCKDFIRLYTTNLNYPYKLRFECYGYSKKKESDGQVKTIL